MTRRAQLRIYRIEDGRLDDFIAGWGSGVVPLRRSFGFRIDGAWTDAATSTFAWVVSYDGDGTFEEADARYYGSPERAGLEPNPARLIVEADTRMLDPLDLDGPVNPSRG